MTAARVAATIRCAPMERHKEREKRQRDSSTKATLDDGGSEAVTGATPQGQCAGIA